MKKLLSALDEITAKEIMTTNVLTISSDSPAGDAARIMLKNGIHSLPIVDNTEKDKILNIVTSFDLISLTYYGRFSEDTEYIKTTKISKLTENQNLITVSPETSLKEILEIIAKKGIRTVPVVEHGKMVGIISVIDIVKKIVGD